MARRKRTAIRSEEIRSAVPVNPVAEFEGGRIEYYLTEIFAFLRNNLKETVLVAAAIVLALVGASVYWNHLEKQSEQSLLDFEKLLQSPAMTLGSGNDRKAGERLEEYAKTHPGTAARRRSEIIRLDYLAETREFVKAAEVALRLAADLDYPEQRAYFHLRAAIYYENAGKYSLALESYSRVSTFLREETYPRAVAVFGEARCLLSMGRRPDGLTKMRELLGMEKVERIERLRAQAAAFLAALPPEGKRTP